MANAPPSSLTTVKAELFPKFFHRRVVVLRIVEDCIPNFVGDIKALEHLCYAGSIRINVVREFSSRELDFIP